MTPAIFYLALVTGLAGMVIGRHKGHAVWGFFLGFLLSVFGLVVIICARKTPEVELRDAIARQEADDEARRQLRDRY